MRRHPRLDRSPRRRWRLGLALAGGLALALGAWAPPARARPTRCRSCWAAEPTSMDPSVDTLKSSLVITNTMLETLAMNTPSPDVQALAGGVVGVWWRRRSGASSSSAA